MTSTLPRLRLTDVLRQSWAAAPLRGRTQELARLAYTLGRASQHNLIVSGPRGIGKTALLQGFARAIAEGSLILPRSLPCVALDTLQVAALLRDTQKREQMLAHIARALKHLPDCILVIDDADALLSVLSEPWHVEELFAPFCETVRRHVVIVVSPQRLETLSRTHEILPKHFDTIELTELSYAVCEQIIADQAPNLAQRHNVSITPEALAAVMTTAQGATATAQPRRALHVLDEACAACAVRQEKAVTAQHVAHVHAQRLGVPVVQFSRHDAKALRTLEATLTRRVRGQAHAVRTVANTVQRGWLGLKNPQRPIGSFLFLGPSGVGKTELAKALAHEVYGTAAACTRLDMSEFAEPHNAQRLLGAPPGYVGYDAGGQLTNAVRQRPFSLLLLDEIEKAHPSVFDMFLQVLDDGQLTDGQGQRVDFTNTIVIATSNVGTNEILAAAGADEKFSGNEEFLARVVLPLLLTRFRPEFLNRFDHVVTFNPLTLEVLLDIAQHEIEKIEQRLAGHHVRIQLNQEVLRRKISELYDPRFGARPLKRYLEATCENILAERLLRV